MCCTNNIIFRDVCCFSSADVVLPFYINVTQLYSVDYFAVFVESDFSPVMNTDLRGMFLPSCFVKFVSLVTFVIMLPLSFHVKQKDASTWTSYIWTME